MLNNLERDLGRHLCLQRRLTGIAFPPSRAHPLDPDSWARPTGGLAITQAPQLRVDGEAEQESTEISPKPAPDAYHETDQCRRRREAHYPTGNVGPSVSRIDGCRPAGCG